MPLTFSSTAKDFSRPLASFTLVPSTETHPLTSNVMVVNSSGDLEVYAVHDTPKQAPWSSRGELAIGVGQTYRMISGFQESEPPPEPWDIPSTSNPYPSESVARSDITREESVVRGRGKRNSNTTSFGRGDEDGFPALGSDSGKGPANLAATRPGKSRTYSPAAFRNYNFERSTEREVTAEDPKSGVVDHLGHSSREISRARSRRDKSASRGRKQGARVIQQVVEEDISMVMRSRVIRGYGLNNVRDSLCFSVCNALLNG